MIAIKKANDDYIRNMRDKIGQMVSGWLSRDRADMMSCSRSPLWTFPENADHIRKEKNKSGRCTTMSCHVIEGC